jgi:hypothetical protein
MKEDIRTRMEDMYADGRHHNDVAFYHDALGHPRTSPGWRVGAIIRSQRPQTVAGG